MLTSKHHDGFCLFKSDYTDYSTYGFFGRDICGELADECRKQGLELGFYYSHTLDWYEKDAGGNFNSAMKMPVKHRNHWDYPDDNIDFEKYLYGKCFPQVKEILTNYGDLKLIWFDLPHDITKEQSEELRKFVKSIQPDCQINSRIAHDCSDYESLGDNALPVAPVGVNMECLITLNDTWGYKKNDNAWKTVDETIDILCKTLGSDSSLLLNVGPKGDGTLTPETIDILEKMGEWTARNSEAVYGGVKGNPLPTTFDWGNLAYKDKNVYLYVSDKNKKEINIAIGRDNKIKSVSVLGTDENIKFDYRGRHLTVYQIDTDLVIPVYKVEFENEPVFEKNIVQAGDVLSLGTLWASKVKKGNENGTPERLFYEKNTFIPDYGKHGLCVNKNCQTEFWTNTDEIMCWDAYFEKAGKYQADIIHAEFYPYTEGRNAKLKYALTVGNLTNEINMQEEKERFSCSKTKEGNIRIKRDGGKFNIEKPGKYRIMISHSDFEEAELIEKVVFTKIG